MSQRKPNERAASDTLPVIPEAPPLCATVSGLLVPLKPAVSEKNDYYSYIYTVFKIIMKNKLLARREGLYLKQFSTII